MNATTRFTIESCSRNCFIITLLLTALLPCTAIRSEITEVEILPPNPIETDTVEIVTTVYCSSIIGAWESEFEVDGNEITVQLTVYQTGAQLMDLEPIPVTVGRLDSDEYSYTVSADFIIGIELRYDDFAQGEFRVEDADDEQVIELRENWNLISINLYPLPEYYRDGEARGPDIELMTADIAEQIIQMMDQNGRFYVPHRNFNNIPYWDLSQGYQIRMSEAVNFNCVGGRIAPDQPIPLVAGWNIIPYYPTYDLPVHVVDRNDPDNPHNFYAVRSIIEFLVLMQNNRGQFLVPAIMFSNMDDMTAGQAYQVRVTEACTLIYPPPPDELGVQDSPLFDHWITPSATSESMRLYIEFGDGHSGQVAAFSVSDRLVGVGDIADGRAGVSVWGDDELTDAIDGLVEGEAFGLKVWDAETDRESDLSSYRITEGNGLIYEPHGFSALSASLSLYIPDQAVLTDAYPNPFNSTTTITYNIPIATNVSLELYNLLGQRVQTLFEGYQQAGVHSTNLVANDLPSGLYFVKLSNTHQASTKKVMLIK